MDKSDRTEQNRGRYSSGARATARMACISGAWEQNIVSDVEKMARVPCIGMRAGAFDQSRVIGYIYASQKTRFKFFNPYSIPHTYARRRASGNTVAGRIAGDDDCGTRRHRNFFPLFAARQVRGKFGHFHGIINLISPESYEQSEQE